MKTRQFGSEALQVSDVGLGCWQLGGDWGSVSRDSALRVLDAAVDNGTDFFDTADVYGGGRSEEIIGEFLRTRKRPVFVATKAGRSGRLYPDKYTEKGVRADIEGSLKRLGTDCLDLLQLHCIPAAVMEQGDVFEWLRTLKGEGKIRRFGASVESMDEAELCMRQEGLYSLQIIFNIFRMKPAEVVLKKAAEKKIGIIARVPLASGLLSGKFTKTTTFAGSDHRNYNRDGAAFNVGETFAGVPFDKGVEFADALKAMVPPGLTMAQMALRWILDFEAVSVVIPGATRAEQAAANAEVSDLPRLSGDLHSRLKKLYDDKIHGTIRGPY